MSLTSFYTSVMARLNTRLPSFYGPAPSLPTSGGKVAQCAVLWATPGEPGHRADAVSTADRRDSFTIICVGATALDSLAAADKVRAALTGRVLHPGASPLREVGVAATPAAEPGTDPVRVSTTLSFTTISKEL